MFIVSPVRLDRHVSLEYEHMTRKNSIVKPHYHLQQIFGVHENRVISPSSVRIIVCNGVITR